MRFKFVKIFFVFFVFINSLFASEEDILNASNTLQQMLRSSNNIPQEILTDAKAVVILPNSYRVGFVLSGMGGYGLMSVKIDNEWSYPVFVGLGGGNIGLQAGVQKSDKLLIFLTTDSINKILDQGLKLGADASVAAGPIGASKKNIFTSDVYVYAQEKGLFAGVSIGGVVLSVNDEETMATYGNNMSTKSIINKHVTPKSSYATQRFLEVLNKELK